APAATQPSMKWGFPNHRRRMPNDLPRIPQTLFTVHCSLSTVRGHPVSFPAPRKLPWLLLISAVVIIADRITKSIVASHIPFGEAIPVIPGFLRISHWLNEGAA